ncbi:helix-turn-helix domain-containing protein [Rhodococcus sp. NPDC057014]|uniref:helix-turn-helix domain-containing protein n=1 Tax=Rhodococcus sp. NPDC057014 TaxID=3346000 RepID=UPI003632ED3D
MKSSTTSATCGPQRYSRNEYLKTRSAGLRYIAARSEWGVSEVADTLGVPRSTAHAMLSSFSRSARPLRGEGGYR